MSYLHNSAMYGTNDGYGMISYSQKKFGILKDEIKVFFGPMDIPEKRGGNLIFSSGKDDKFIFL